MMGTLGMMQKNGSLNEENLEKMMGGMEEQMKRNPQVRYGRPGKNPYKF